MNERQTDDRRYSRRALLGGGVGLLGLAAMSRIPLNTASADTSTPDSSATSTVTKTPTSTETSTKTPTKTQTATKTATIPYTVTQTPTETSTSTPNPNQLPDWIDPNAPTLQQICPVMRNVIEGVDLSRIKFISRMLKFSDQIRTAGQIDNPTYRQKLDMVHQESQQIFDRFLPTTTSFQVLEGFTSMPHPLSYYLNILHTNPDPNIAINIYFNDVKSAMAPDIKDSDGSFYPIYTAIPVADPGQELTMSVGGNYVRYGFCTVAGDFLLNEAFGNQRSRTLSHEWYRGILSNPKGDSKKPKELSNNSTLLEEGAQLFIDYDQISDRCNFQPATTTPTISVPTATSYPTSTPTPETHRVFLGYAGQRVAP